MRRTYAANRIRELRKAQGMTQEMVAEGLGGTTTPATVAKLETRARALSLEYIVGIARVLGVTPGEIIEPLRSSSRDIPVLHHSDTSKWREASQAAPDVVPVPATLPGKNLFAVHVEGRSLDHLMPDGGFVVVNPDDLQLMHGKVYAIGHGQHSSFRRFGQLPPRLLPCSTNQAHVPLDIGREPFVTIGRVVFMFSPL